MTKTIILSPAGYDKSARFTKWFLRIWGSGTVLVTIIIFFKPFDSTFDVVRNIVLFLAGVSGVITSFYYDINYKNLPKVFIDENKLLIRSSIFSRNKEYKRPEIRDIHFEKKQVVISLNNGSVQKVRLRTDYDVMLEVRESINRFMKEKAALV